MQIWRFAYRKFVNIAFIILGWCFFIGGCVGSIYGCTSLSNPQIPPIDAWLTVVIFGTVAFLGVLLIKARHYITNIFKKNGDN